MSRCCVSTIGSVTSQHRSALVPPFLTSIVTDLLYQHQIEIQRNLIAWRAKPLLQRIYRGFYLRVVHQIDPAIPGSIVEIGSGIGNFKSHLKSAIATDLFPNTWLDVACDCYELPFRNGTVSHLVLFDVFHHLRAPNAFLREARRVLTDSGRIVMCEPYISICSFLIYGALHDEPVAWRSPINQALWLSRPRDYYAAQGNATRLFFRKELAACLKGWIIFHAEAFSCFCYLLSGGFSKKALYPLRWLDILQWYDKRLSYWPKCFGARCVVGLCPD